MIVQATWLACLVGLPVSVIAVSAFNVHVERLRRVAVACAALLTVTAVLPFLVPDALTFAVSPCASPPAIIGPHALRVDTLASVLLPLASALWLLTVAVTPRSWLDRRGLRRTALATLITLGCFLTESPGLLVVLSTASVVVFLTGLSAPANRRARRVAATYLGGATVLFAAGVLLSTWPGAAGTWAERWGLWLILAAALIRKGIFPFHAWVPDVFDRGRLGPAVLFSAPQLGAYVTAVLVVPHASAGALRVVAVLALVTTVYGAALALTQRDARRACGYLFVSQSALVMAGLDCTSTLALAGSLVLWISSGLAFAGIARCVIVLEARRGRLDLTRHHGGYEQMPLLAVSFLVLGLACTGFPGTLGFIGEELLVAGAIEAFPVIGFCVIIAGALTGLAVLRMYFSLFCGRRDQGIQLGLLRREAVAFAAIAAFLIGTGVAPRAIVTAQLSASEQILQLRHGGGEAALAAVELAETVDNLDERDRQLGDAQAGGLCARASCSLPVEPEKTPQLEARSDAQSRPALPRRRWRARPAPVRSARQRRAATRAQSRGYPATGYQFFARFAGICTPPPGASVTP